VAELLVGSIIALVAAFGGAGYGSWLSTRQAVRLDARRDREERRRRSREVRAAARLVWFDLGMTALQAEGAVANHDLVGLRAAPRAAWTAHGGLLAAELPVHALEPVAEAMSRSAAAAELVAAGQPGVTTSIKGNDGALEAAKELGRICRMAQDALADIDYDALSSTTARPS
jgi:hypothetical protein